MRIDAAGHDDLAGRVDQSGAVRDREGSAGGHGDYALAGNRYVVRTNALWRHHGIATHHQIDHRRFLSSAAGLRIMLPHLRNSGKNGRFCTG
jgi:hypothetical protein